MGNTQCASADRKDTDCSLFSADEFQDGYVEVSKWQNPFREIPTLMRNARRASDVGIQICDLHVGQACMDPTKAHVKSELLRLLGLPSNLEVKKFGVNQAGNTVANGFNNAGLWSIASSSRDSPDLILKLVSSEYDERKKFENLAAAFPSITSDPHIAFPSLVIRCIKSKDDQPDDLVVMQKANGVELHDFVTTKLRQDRRHALPVLLYLFEQIGASLADFHARYGNKQHGDFQPANIIYDETSKKITFIDVGNMGSPMSPPGADVKQFTSAIRAIYTHYGPSFAEAFEQRFVSGYDSRKK